MVTYKIYSQICSWMSGPLGFLVFYFEKVVCAYRSAMLPVRNHLYHHAFPEAGSVPIQNVS